MHLQRQAQWKGYLRRKEHRSHMQVLVSYFSPPWLYFLYRRLPNPGPIMVFKAIAWFRESTVKPLPFLQVLCSGHYRMFLAIVCLPNHIGEKQLYVFSNFRDHRPSSPKNLLSHLFLSLYRMRFLIFITP